MKYTLAVIALIAAFYLGAHSQKQGPTFVTGIQAESGPMMTGQIHIQSGSPEFYVSGSENTIYIRLAPSYHIERDKQ